MLSFILEVSNKISSNCEKHIPRECCEKAGHSVKSLEY